MDDFTREESAADRLAEEGGQACAHAAHGDKERLRLTEVDEKSRKTWKRGRLEKAHRTRCGGTCFEAPTKHANARTREFDGYLILTDGYAPDPGPSRLRRGWVITPDGAAQDWMRRGNDFVIEMKWPAKKEAA